MSDDKKVFYLGIKIELDPAIIREEKLTQLGI